MEVRQTGSKVVITDICDFSPEQVFDCGQAFRWNRDDEGYIGIVGSKVIKAVYEESAALILHNCSLNDFENNIRHYLDLDRDYSAIKRDLSKDPILREAIQYGSGIRILNQDPWETLISFIISANNNISRIKKIIESLSARFGKAIEYEGRVFYTFPEPEALAAADEQDLKACGCGYRGPYIKATARMVADGLLNPALLKSRAYEEAHKELLGCMGVGDKVADCIALFSLEKTEAFPVDVWVRRIMEYLYIKPEKQDSVSNRDIKAYAAEKFGKYAGLAQQYLFYYAREQKIGK